MNQASLKSERPSTSARSRGNDLILPQPAVFFDRDGVLNLDKGYVYRQEDFEWMPGGIESIKYFNNNGFRVFVVTNQSGIARGYYREEDVIALHSWMSSELANHQAHIDRFYYCPHHPEGQGPFRILCNCRKPMPGLILQATKEWNLNLEQSLLVGDKESDIEAARAAGIRGYRFPGGNLYDFLQEHNIIG